MKIIKDKVYKNISNSNKKDLWGVSIWRRTKEINQGDIKVSIESDLLHRIFYNFHTVRPTSQIYFLNTFPADS